MSSNTQYSGTTPSTNLASLYECPVCFEYILPPIFQCSNGHMVCSNCSPRLDRCPSCQGQIGTCRNLFMEKALSDVQFPCKYSDQGCQVTMLLMEKTAHEENCLSRPIYSCPVKPVCKWKGPIDQIVPHLLSQHNTLRCTQGDQFHFKVEMGTFLRPESKRRCALRLHKCHDRDFLFAVKKEARKKSADGHDYDRISAAVQLIGSKSEAKQFSYSLILRGDHHRLMWDATPLSLNDNLDSAARTHECLVFESTDIGRIFSRNGQLIFDVKIGKNKKIDGV